MTRASSAAAPVPRAEAVVDLRAIADNVSVLRDRVRGVPVMAVVKADAYGHGLVPAAGAARAGGAEWLGVAVLDEALALRTAGDTGRILSWMAAPGEDWAAAIGSGIDVTAYSESQLSEILGPARDTGQVARVQLKVDSGLGRGGSLPVHWAGLVAAARRAETDGLATITGIWSHLATADEPGHPALADQERVFAEALEVADAAGLRPEVRHLANSAALLTRESTWYDLVRAGLAIYGLSPIPDLSSSADLGLRPAMTLQARVVIAKRIDAGHGVSYGHTFVAKEPTNLALIPLGYGDGIPWHASNRGTVLLGGRQHRIAGRVCMDQFVVDLGDDSCEAGDLAVLFGTGEHGEPTAQDWAEAAGTISYEIVTRLGPRIPRRYLGADQGVVSR